MEAGGLRNRMGGPPGSSSPYSVVDPTTPNSNKKRLLIPKKSALDGRTPGKPGTPMTGGATGGGMRTAGGGQGTPSYLRGGGIEPLLGYTDSDSLYSGNGGGSGYGAAGGGYGGNSNGGGRMDHVVAHRNADHTPARDRNNDTTLNYSTWVVVFGMAESKNAAQMHFSACGEIVDSVESAGNWMFLEFREPASAERALKMNGKLISSGTIIGVEKLTASRAVELNLQISQRVHGNANRQEFPIPRNQGTPATPYYLKAPKKRDSICAMILKLFGLGAR